MITLVLLQSRKMKIYQNLLIFTSKSIYIWKINYILYATMEQFWEIS